MKKKILIPLSTDHGIRNFIHSGAFDQLEETYDVHYRLASGIETVLQKPRVLIVSDKDVAARSHARWRWFYTSMKRYEKRCVSFPVKYREIFYKHLNARQKCAAWLVARPGVTEFFLWANERALGLSSEIEKAFEHIKPDFVLNPCSFNDSFSLDCLKSTRTRKLPNLMLMFNWDNVSSKGVLPFNPDYLGVWGPQTKQHAVDIHGIPSENIFLLGSPQFEVYLRPPGLNRDEFHRRYGIPLDKAVILIAGISQYINETALLEFLEEAIERGELGNAYVFYRPHPWRAHYEWEKDFFDVAFKHVMMDPQVSENYRKGKKSSADKPYDPKGHVPAYDYYPSLINAVDAVISMGTTLGLEAMVMGKPILVKSYPEDIPVVSHHLVIQTFAHHDCWRKMKTVILCEEKKNFISDCRQLLRVSQDPQIAKRVREDIKYVVFDDSQPYAMRLKDCVDRILSSY